MNLLLPEVFFAMGILAMLTLPIIRDMSLRKPFLLLILLSLLAQAYFSMDQPIWMIQDYGEYQFFRLFPSGGGFFSQNGYIVMFKMLILSSALIIALTMPQGWFRSFREIPLLISMGLLGMLLTVTASDLIALYLSVELQLNIQGHKLS